MGHCKWIGFHGLRMRARERDASAEKALVQEKGWENRPGYTIALFSTPERKYCLQAEITMRLMTMRRRRSNMMFHINNIYHKHHYISTSIYTYSKELYIAEKT